MKIMLIALAMVVKTSLKDKKIFKYEYGYVN